MPLAARVDSARPHDSKAGRTLLLDDSMPDDLPESVGSGRPGLRAARQGREAPPQGARCASAFDTLLVTDFGPWAALNCPLLERMTGFRTRDPHLGKVEFLVWAVYPSPPPCRFVHPVSTSSTPSAAVVERSTKTFSSDGQSRLGSMWRTVHTRLASHRDPLRRLCWQREDPQGGRQLGSAQNQTAADRAAISCDGRIGPRHE